MSDSWIRELIGELPDNRPTLAKLPGIDFAIPAASPHVSAQADRFLKQKEVERNWESMFGEPLSKSAPAGFDNRTYEDSAQPTPPKTFTMPTPTPDPRKKLCFCDCPQCVRQSCASCLGDPETGQRCEFSSLGVLDDVLDVSEEVQDEMQQAAAAKQLGRLRKAKVARHRDGMKSLVDTFKADLRPLSNRVSPLLFENLLDSMAAYVAEAQAAEWR
jgi:hypothetical protein